MLGRSLSSYHKRRYLCQMSGVKPCVSGKLDFTLASFMLYNQKPKQSVNDVMSELKLCLSVTIEMLEHVFSGIVFFSAALLKQYSSLNSCFNRFSENGSNCKHVTAFSIPLFKLKDSCAENCQKTRNQQMAKLTRKPE